MESRNASELNTLANRWQQNWSDNPFAFINHSSPLRINYVTSTKEKWACPSLIVYPSMLENPLTGKEPQQANKGSKFQQHSKRRL